MATAETQSVPVTKKTSDSQFRLVLRRLFGKNVVIVSVAFLILSLLCAVLPGLVAPHDPFEQDLLLRLKPPSFVEGGVSGYLLGTDHLGRDTLSRIIFGARITLVVSVLAVAVSMLVGVAAGLAAGFYGGRTDSVIQRLIDMQLAFPVILLVIAVVAVVGPSLTNLIIIMGLSGWPRFARIVRGAVLSVRGLEYVEAARAIGAGQLRIMTHHILPNILSAIIVYASFELARMILLEATLSFLGLGVQPPTPTWGGMISDGKNYISISWWVSLFPGLAIGAIILAFNILGDELRDALDPQLTHE
ncbi:peptide/nickel transport system permease protein [Nitratireductor aquibiodomus]|uniref:Peptide/nickel transport system permease protein n=1 Tax=Nitratireductor aquibiodomus TaxID=204799 RepID=A0A1H4L4D0_9HYPH|nr:ABC transporter permease [Nitratireductor aquibiodomus]SEB65258.1 peptide/nickel transport system permease protein [Nitratireductor aquibiodomus]